jgi:replicative DNA helicase
MSQFKFSRDFQVEILALMFQDYDFLMMTHDLVQPEYFSDSILAWFFCTMRDYYLDYQMRVGAQALKNEILKACRLRPRPKITKSDIPLYSNVFQRLHNKVQDREYIAKEVSTFCRHQAIKAAVLESPALLKEEKFEEIEQMVRQAVQVGTQTLDLGEQYFIDWPERLRRQVDRAYYRTMPTGVTELDLLLNGGLKVKQLGIWMAPTNRGKSIALGHCAKRALTIKKKVLHYTMELSQDEVSARYDSALTKIPVNDLIEEEVKLVRKLERYGKRYGNSLMIKEYPTKQASVATLRSHIMQCMSLGFDPDLIIVDYLDLLQPPRHYKEKRDELSAIAEELRGLACEMCLPVWTATQATRGAISMETHTEQDVSEDIGKMNISDVVITINQTKEEVDDDIMRLYIAKNRNGPRYKTIKIKTAFERMCFFEVVREG